MSRNAPYPSSLSCDALERWTAEFGHPVENLGADFSLSFLVFEVARP